MASSIKLTHQAILDALATISPGGGYVHDLSVSGRVARGRVDSPPVLPFCTVSCEGFKTSDDSPVGQWRRDHLFILVAWAEVSGTSEKDRDDGAQDLMNDLMVALEADRSLGGNVFDLTIDGDAYHGNDPTTGAHLLQAVLLLTVWQRRTTGV